MLVKRCGLASSTKLLLIKANTTAGVLIVKQNLTLRILIFIVGAAIIGLGLNIALGGIQTLGWQNSGDFFSVTNMPTFRVQDNHFRFLGGVWFGVGATFVLGSFALDRLRPVLVALCGIIAIAGLFRFSAKDIMVIFSFDIAPSLMLELVGFPLLAWWLMRSGNTSVPKSKAK